jgi:hypothetical protein
MPGNPLVRFDEGRVGRTARCRPLSYSTVRAFSRSVEFRSDRRCDRYRKTLSRQAARLAKSFILARDFNGMRGTCNMLQIAGRR